MPTDDRERERRQQALTMLRLGEWSWTDGEEEHIADFMLAFSDQENAEIRKELDYVRAELSRCRSGHMRPREEPTGAEIRESLLGMVRVQRQLAAAQAELTKWRKAADVVSNHAEVFEKQRDAAEEQLAAAREALEKIAVEALADFSIPHLYFDPAEGTLGNGTDWPFESLERQGPDLHPLVKPLLERLRRIAELAKGGTGD